MIDPKPIVSVLLTVDEREHFALKMRLNAILVRDTAARRRLDNVWEQLGLDELPVDVLGPLNSVSTAWGTALRQLSLTLDQADALISWIEPSAEAPLNGYLSRILGAIYDRLKKAREDA